MKLTNDMRRALAIKNAGPWKVAGFAVRIRRGTLKLGSLTRLSKDTNLSLAFLVSGGEYEQREYMRPVDGVRKSIMHAGYDLHDFARQMGFRDFRYVESMLTKETIPVKTLMRFAETLGLEIWELLTDSECYAVSYETAIPTQWDQLVELNLMGWLDSKDRNQYTKKNGPGI